ncbi:MAG TPA: RluA family pseudouridine synthase [Actinomycetota bacterium]
MIELRIEAADAGERADALIAARTETPRSRVQASLRSGELTVNGHPVRPSYRVAAGDEIRGTVAIPDHAPPEAEDIPISVRHSDDRVLVISKPAGLVTHPATGHRSGTLVNALLGMGVPLSSLGSDRPGIVHRLDKETSGLMLIAKDDGTHRFLKEELRARRVERRYRALVRGVPGASSGTIDAPIARHPTKRRLMAVVPGGRSAVTHYVVMGRGEGLALLDVGLETGRTHQIRVHLAHLGHPVLGDRVHGGLSDLSRRLGLERPFLHATKLTWPDPVTGEPVTVEDDLPADLVAALEAAGLAPRGA